MWEIIGGNIAAIAALLGVVGALIHGRPARWVMRRIVSDPLTGWLDDTTTQVVRREVNGKLDRIETKVDANTAAISTTAASIAEHTDLDQERFDAVNERLDVIQHDVEGGS